MELREQYKQSRKRLIDADNRCLQKEGMWGDWVKKAKGLSSTNWYLQNSHGNVKYNIGNIVNNIVMTMYAARWQYRGEHFEKYMIV